jgi:hydroxyquinol 1,2-dioxygenase
LHFIASAPGCESVTTQIFASDSPELRRDAVFGVSDGLIASFVTHAAGTAPDGRVLSTPFCTVDYAIRLRRA